MPVGVKRRSRYRGAMKSEGYFTGALCSMQSSLCDEAGRKRIIELLCRFPVLASTSQVSNAQNQSRFTNVPLNRQPTTVIRNICFMPIVICFLKHKSILKTDQMSIFHLRPGQRHLIKTIRS